MRTLWLVVALAACGDDAHVTADAPMHGPADAPPDSPPLPDPDALTPAELTAIGMLSPLPAPPADPTNAYAESAAAAALGQMLFFDKSYAGALVVGNDGTNGGLGNPGDTGKVSCASCHAPGSATLDDQRSHPNNVSLGTDFGPRNAPGIVDSAFYAWTNWGGRFDSQWSLPLAVAENPKIMNSTRLQVVHMLWTKYRAEYNAIFPVPLDPRLDPADPNASAFPAAGKPGVAAWDTTMVQADRDIAMRIYANYGKAIAAYLRKINSRNARFDQFVGGDRIALSHSEIHGLKLFLAKGCTGCHGGPHFEDGTFHALLVPQTGLHVPATDLGRNADVPPLLASPFNVNGAYSDDITTLKLDTLVQTEAQKGQFRTRSLRDVAGSAPYMHAGQLATLADVIAFYNTGGGDPGATGIVKDPLIVPLNLSAADQADLVAFLGTLDGEGVSPMLVVDTSH
jgi:cytochrome c peroxidase